MEKVNLINNGVTFKEEEHEYWLGDKQLFGITSAIQHQVAKSEYDNCPEYLIKKAGQYGSDVHKSIQRLINDFEHDGTVETEDFRELTKDMNIEACEYNVSDFEHWASNIDIVVRVSDNEFDLYDIKTYSNSKLTKTQLLKAKFQLSIYAMLFEGQNKGAKVRNLGIMHISNKIRKDGSENHISETLPVDRIPNDVCQNLLDCELQGTQFQNPYDIPKDVASKVNRIIKLIQTKKEAEEELNAIKKDVLETMLFLDVKSWKGENITFSRIEETQRSSFDLVAFKKAYPDLPYDSYVKTSKVAGSLKIAV